MHLLFLDIWKNIENVVKFYKNGKACVVSIECLNIKQLNSLSKLAKNLSDLLLKFDKFYFQPFQWYLKVKFEVYDSNMVIKNDMIE